MHALSAVGHCRTHGLLPACFLHAHLLHAHLLLLINWFQLVVVWWPLARCGVRYFLPARLPARLLAGSLAGLLGAGGGALGHLLLLPGVAGLVQSGWSVLSWET